MKESRNEKKKRMETKRNNIIRRLFNREYLRIFPKKENKNTIFLEIQFTWKETHFIRSINIVNKAISRLITHPIDWSINMFSFNRENNYSSVDKRSWQSHERYWQRYRRDERRRCRYINPRGPGSQPLAARGRPPVPSLRKKIPPADSGRYGRLQKIPRDTGV